MPEPTFDPAPPPSSSRSAERDPPPRRSSWDGGSDGSHVKTFVIAASLMALIGLGALAARADVAALWRRHFGPPLTSAELRARADACERRGELACAQEALAGYLKLRPDDAVAHARLGHVMARRDDDVHAVAEYQRAIDSGEGTYDLFAWYAESLGRVGRTDEAIEWSYRSLSLVPNLVDVRGSLARMLVARGRGYEALSLLESFDADAESRGRGAYFAGQRIAIETALTAPAAASAPTALRLPVMGGHFYAPVSLGAGRPLPFVVDTGATVSSVTAELLAESRAPYRVVQAMVMMTTADGRRVAAQGISIEAISVGPFHLRNVQAVLCTHCVSLLGQSSLSHFDLKSTRTQGVEFLTMTPRTGV
jgi:clan AA aspartic protease (TIGR02281 family)